MVDEPSLPISGSKKSQWEGNCDVSLLKTEVLSTWMPAKSLIFVFCIHLPGAESQLCFSAPPFPHLYNGYFYLPHRTYVHWKCSYRLRTSEYTVKWLLLLLFLTSLFFFLYSLFPQSQEESLLLMLHVRGEDSACWVAIMAQQERVGPSLTAKGSARSEGKRGRVCVCSAVSVVSTSLHPVDSGPPGSSVRGISQERILEWAAMASSRGSSQPRELGRGSCR